MDAGSAPIRVLHVDDEPGFADLAAEQLRRQDDAFEVEVATSAGDGVEQLDGGDFDCVVSDYDMPGQNGIEFLKAVRADAPDLPFILFTGKGSEEIASDAISAGVTDYLQKSHGSDQYAILANRIKNAVEGYRAQRAAEDSERRLRSVYERITDGFFGVDTDWRYTYVNEEGARIVGLEKADLVGERVWDVFPDLVDSDFETALRTAMESQETTSVEEFYPAHDTWYDVRVYPAEDGISIYFQDVTERKAHERELERERSQFRALYDNFPEPTITYEFEDPGAVISGVNDAFVDVFGYEAEAAVGTPVNDLLVPSDRIEEAESIDERVRAGESVDQEVRRATADGERSFRFRNISLPDGSGPDGVAVYADVTERKERIAELERFETLLDLLPDRAVVTNLDGEMTQIYGRQQAWGYESTELVGEHISTAMPPEALERAERIATELITSDDAETATYEADVLTKSGDRIPVEVRLAPLPPDDDGTIPGTINLLRNISERRERVRELEHLSERLEFVLQETNTVIWEVDLEEEQASLLHGPATTLYGTDVAEADSPEAALSAALHPDDVADVLEAFRAVKRGEQAGYRIDYRTQPDDGEVRWIESIAGIDESADRWLRGLSTEITDRKLHERELEAQNERLEEFASVVSHDLRNPLNVAQGRIDLAAEECDSDHLAHVRTGLDDMETLIEDLLVLARGDEGHRHVETVDLASVCEQCWANVVTEGATLDLDVETAVRADRTRLRQLLENLFGNALEHAGDGVTVTVVDLEDGQGFAVADDGPGIPADLRERIFEFGFSASADGTGFGLAIVEQIADDHGWAVSVGESVDGGARFEIRTGD